jgi:hypothetical protein
MARWLASWGCAALPESESPRRVRSHHNEPGRVAKAAGLGAPTAGKEAWARVLEDFALYEKPIATAGAAAKTGNLQGWKPAEESWSAARETVREDLVKGAGVGAESTCSLLFAPPGRPRQLTSSRLGTDDPLRRESAPRERFITDRDRQSAAAGSDLDAVGERELGVSAADVPDMVLQVVQ